MSIESAKAFLQRMKTDREFATQLSELKNSAESRKFIQSAGYNFTDEELKACSAELTDDELDSVAGGGSTVCVEICEIVGASVGHNF